MPLPPYAPLHYLERADQYLGEAFIFKMLCYITLILFPPPNGALLYTVHSSMCVQRVGRHFWLDMQVLFLMTGCALVHAFGIEELFLVNVINFNPNLIMDIWVVSPLAKEVGNQVVIYLSHDVCRRVHYQLYSGFIFTTSICLVGERQ